MTTVKQNIKLKWGRADLVFDTLESKNRSSVLYAMHMYDLQAVSLSDMFNAEGATWFPDFGDELSQDALRSDIRKIMSLEGLPTGDKTAR